MYLIAFEVGFGGGGTGGSLARTKPSYWAYLLIDEYFSAETTRGKDLQQAIMIFDRKVSDKIRIKLPHLGHEERFHRDILSVRWNSDEKEELLKTPGLLLTERSWRSFDPRLHPWVYINLRDFLDQSGHILLPKLRDFLSRLASAINSDKKILKELETYIATETVKESTRIFELKPNFFGIGIDVKEMVRFLKKRFL